MRCGGKKIISVWVKIELLTAKPNAEALLLIVETAGKDDKMFASEVCFHQDQTIGEIVHRSNQTSHNIKLYTARAVNYGNELHLNK